MVFAIAGLNLLALNDIPSKKPGDVLLVLSMFVAYWSGLRAGIIASLLADAYMLYFYSIPGKLFHYTPEIHGGIIAAVIIIPLCALLVGALQNKLRTAGMRLYDARVSMEAEAEGRQQAEGDLQSSEELRRLVVDSAMDAIVAIDETGAVSLWNPSAEAVFGWTSAEMVGRSVAATLIPAQFRESFSIGFERFLATGEGEFVGRRLELVGITKSGVELPIEISVVPHKTPDGHLFVAFIRDITEQKKLNQRLRQSQKMEAIGTLAGGIAHDFNNILGAISGNVLLAKADLPEDHPVVDSLVEIDKAVLRAGQVVRQILTFSSNAETKAVSMDIAAGVTEAIKLLRATVPASMEIVMDFEQNLPPILADPTDIHQIVLNLGINAYQAMSGSSGRLDVQVNRQHLDKAAADSLLNLSPGNYVHLAFRDTGRGIDHKTLQRIFEPFFTTKSVGEGTGLGLSVVYGIVERHGGAITVYSEQGKGTVFHLYFPVTTGAQEISEPKTPATVSGQGQRILYVDDDEALVYMMIRMLRKLNYEVEGFVAPEEALTAFKDDPNAFDAVITDISMPLISGPELVKLLREVRENIPIVMVTGFIRPADLEVARDLGIEELVLKPNTAVEMSEVLATLFEKIQFRESTHRTNG